MSNHITIIGVNTYSHIHTRQTGMVLMRNLYIYHVRVFYHTLKEMTEKKIHKRGHYQLNLEYLAYAKKLFVNIIVSPRQ